MDPLNPITSLKTIETKIVDVFQFRHIPTYLSIAGGQFGNGYLWSCFVDFVCHWSLGMYQSSFLWRFVVMCLGLLLNTAGIMAAVQLHGPDHILHLIPFQMGLSLGQPLFMNLCQNFAKDIKSGLFTVINGTAAPPVSEVEE